MACYRVTLTFTACDSFQYVNFFPVDMSKAVKFNRVLIPDFLVVIHIQKLTQLIDYVFRSRQVIDLNMKAIISLHL